MSVEIPNNEIPYNVIFLRGEHNPQQRLANRPLPKFLSGLTQEFWDLAKTKPELFEELKRLENLLQLDIGLGQMHRYSGI